MHISCRIHYSVRRLLPRLLSLLLAWFLASQTGCELVYFMDGTAQGTYGYVLRLGSANRITEWGLQQVDDDRIYDAMSALNSYAVRHRNEPGVHDAVVADMLRIYNKLITGWPGYTGLSRYRTEDATGPLSSERVQHNLDRQIEIAYGELLALNAREVYLSLQPNSEVFPGRYKDWWYQGKLHDVAELKNYPVPGAK